MSVAAMTIDDQRPLMNNYDKSIMSKQYEQNFHSSGGAPSGPASPTPSGSEEPTSQPQQYAQQQHTHHHHPHHHHHHHHHQQQQPLQQQQPQLSTVVDAVTVAEQRQRMLEEEIENLKLEQTRLTQQCADAQRREKILMRRLANKEQEFQDYVSQIAEYKAAQAPTAMALRSALLDPAVNLLFEKLKKELKATKAKLEETQNELAAWKFTPDSNTGKRLMAKCRLLYQENEELGKMTSNGRLAKLETELAMQKSFSEEVKKSQSELDDFLQELDEDVEGMQSTILFLQQELKTTRDRIQVLEKENYQLKSDGVGGGGDDCIKDVTAPTILLKDDPNAKDLAATPHVILNGNVAGPTTITTAVTTPNIAVVPTIISYNNSKKQLAAAAAAAAAASINEMKYTPMAVSAMAAPVTSTLETIDENTCLRAPQRTIYYNGNNDGEPQQPPLSVNLAATDVSSSNNSANAGAKLRPLKRPYEDIDATNETTNASETLKCVNNNSNTTNTTTTNVVIATPTIIATHVSSPRTLPPKKSKLRVTPARRASVQSVDLSENNDTNYASNLVTAGGVGGIAAETVGIVVDNAVAGMANEEITPTQVGMQQVVDDVVVVDATVTGVAQRIMTRRRSLRTQQNGGSSVGESNH